MSETTVQDVFTTHIPERLKAKPEVVEGINAVYQFTLTGDDAANYIVDLTKKEDWVSQGESADPGVTITMATKDFLDMVTGKLRGEMAFMQGKLKIKGDMSLAMKLQQILG